MKKIVIHNEIFIVLKNDTFHYCHKKYTQQRFIHKNGKILITQDDGFHYARIYTGIENGKAKDITQDLTDANISSHPYYHYEDKKFPILEALKIAQHPINVHKSHFQ